jgi:hypothetical protein
VGGGVFPPPTLKPALKKEATQLCCLGVDLSLTTNHAQTNRSALDLQYLYDLCLVWSS